MVINNTRYRWVPIRLSCKLYYMEDNNASSLERSSTVEQWWPFHVHIGDAAVVHLKGTGAMLWNIGNDDTLLDVQVKPEACLQLYMRCLLCSANQVQSSGAPLLCTHVVTAGVVMF